MEEQDKHSDKPEALPPSDEGQNGNPIIRSLSPVTRQLTQQQPKAAEARPEQRAIRERIVYNVQALGDPTHPMHHEAVDELVKIGDAAVPALNEALNPRRPWLTAYRAAEALGRIGDGRATGALIEALRHPNSNVRWGAVRALSAIGDARALLDLRRVAREDRSKTSWGESVSGAAESALDQMRSQNVLLRGTELIKTAVACVLMLVALVVAWSVLTNLRANLGNFGGNVTQSEAPQVRVIEPTPAASLPASTPDAAASVPTEETTTDETGAISGSVTTTANVRSLPSRDAGRIGVVSDGDQIFFEGISEDGEWYQIRLGSRRSAGSRIDSTDGIGWVTRAAITEPSASLPIIAVDTSTLTNESDTTIPEEPTATP